MRRRLEQLEARSAQPPAAPPPRTQRAAAAPAPRRAPAPPVEGPAAEARAAAAEARAAAAETTLARQEFEAAQQRRTGPIAGLAPPTPQGEQDITGDALRSDLPGLSLRIPGTETEVRLYGFAKVTAWQDGNGRNQSDAPLPSGIPLQGSIADRQGGEFGMTARFSRFGLDTRSLTGWGTLETRIEGDFGGGSPTSSNAVFRLRQAFADLNMGKVSLLIGQANSLWNEGLFETIIDATNLNQSFIRQAQFRFTGRLTDKLSVSLSAEAPETNVVSGAGTFNPDSGLDGGATPAFNAMPDLLTRITYRQGRFELMLRGLLRELQVRPENAGIPGTGERASATGWGFALHTRVPLGTLWQGFGHDEFVVMGFYGQGIGRYFFGVSNGVDAVSNLGLASAPLGLRLTATESYGVTAAYRRFWTPTLRSNFSYSAAWQEFPAYAREFAPGSAQARALNNNLQQVFANLIWSPFGQMRDGVFSSGWLDVGIEYLYTRRDLFGGTVAAGPGVKGYGIANRVLVGVVARF
ncbi:MAG: porin [Rubritepida sp.]|nr:porin [Rubritepida sp.]